MHLFLFCGKTAKMPIYQNVLWRLLETFPEACQAFLITSMATFNSLQERHPRPSLEKKIRSAFYAKLEHAIYLRHILILTVSWISAAE